MNRHKRIAYTDTVIPIDQQDTDFHISPLSTDYPVLNQLASACHNQPIDVCRQQLSRTLGPEPDLKKMKQLLHILDRLETRHHQVTYPLREAIFQLGRDRLESWQVFTMGERPLQQSGDTIWRVTEQPEKWILERRAIHAKAQFHHMIRAHALSRHICQTSGCKNSIVILGGNYGVGKTELIATFHPGFELGADKAAIGSDNAKEQVRRAPAGSACATPNAIHREASQIANDAANALFKETDQNIILDASLNNLATAEKYIATARKHKKQLAIHYITAPLHISLLRVLARPENGLDPRIPFHKVITNYHQVRQTLMSLLPLATKNSDVCQLNVHTSAYYKTGMTRILKTDTGPLPEEQVRQLNKTHALYDALSNPDALGQMRVKDLLQPDYFCDSEAKKLALTFNNRLADSARLQAFITRTGEAVPESLARRLTAAGPISYLELPVKLALNWHASL